MESSHTAELNIPDLNAAASIAHFFPGMANHYFLSVGQLCNEGYLVTFKNSSLTVCDSQKFQNLNGPRDSDTGLWRINLKQNNQQIYQPVANNVYELIANAPLLPRVVTTVTRTSPPPGVPKRTENLSPRNLSQDTFYDMDTAHMAIALENHHWSQKHQSNAVVHPVTRKDMAYTALMKDPRLQPFWKRGFGNKCGRLAQVIRDIPGTNTCFFIKLTNIPKDRKITYCKIVCDYKPHKTEKERVRFDELHLC
jgi:hypothetical protein